MYYISYFANMKNIPSNIEVIGVVNKMQSWLLDLGIRNISDLAPTSQIIRLWKNGEISWDEYTYLYVRDVISQLEIQDIILQLGHDNVCMCCYEKNGQHCHRYIIQKWFKAHGIEVKEI